MAAKLLLILILSLSLIILLTLSKPNANAELVNHNAGLGLINETLEWQFEAQQHLEPETIEEEEEEDEDEDGLPRRSLYWKAPGPRRRYYISYGALSANRVPCPPRSGRSYYTHNCFRARGSVHPYTRSCSAITRCRR